MLDDMVGMICRDLPEVIELAAEAQRLDNTCNLACPGIKAQALQARLDLAGYAVSVGSACMARYGEPSHVIAALPIDEHIKGSNIRISIGGTTTAEELTGFAAAYVDAVQAMRQR